MRWKFWSKKTITNKNEGFITIVYDRSNYPVVVHDSLSPVCKLIPPNMPPSTSRVDSTDDSTFNEGKFGSFDVNPATGLPMYGAFDTAGNQYGFSSCGMDDSLF